MAELSASMQRLVDICSNLDLGFVKLMRPGLRRESILQMTKPLDLTLPSQLIEFYEFCDGVDAWGHTPEEMGVYYGYWFSPLHEAVEMYLHFREQNFEDMEKSWFPLLRFYSDHYFVDCSLASLGKPYVGAYSFEDEPYIEYQSIQSMIDTFADCYQEGAFSAVDGKAEFTAGWAETEISLRHNPNVPFLAE